jgi:GT2 family glycosyltransferase
MMARPVLSVVIVNYRSWDDLQLCLDALQQDPLGDALEVIVVDNDGSAGQIPARYPTVVYLPQPENRWFCAGNNIGLAATQGEYVLLLNPDTVPQGDALKQMVDFLRSAPEYAGVTVQLRYPDGSIQRTCSAEPSYLYLLVNHSLLGVLFPAWRERLNAAHWYEGWNRDSSRDVRVLPGSCLMMRRGDLWLDEQLLLYFPEDDLARRFPDRRFRFLAEPTITHREKSVTQSWTAQRVYFRDLLLYTNKYYGVWGWLLMWIFSRGLLLGLWLRQRLSISSYSK